MRLSQATPGSTSDRHIAGETALQIAKSHATHQPANIGDDLAHVLHGGRIGPNGHDQKYRGARQRRNNALRLNRNPVSGISHPKTPPEKSVILEIYDSLDL
jgi:hypothetical protein